MNELIGRVYGFAKQVFPDQSDLYAKLATDGQSPKALMISCADSRVVPEHIMQAAPGDLFVCRNAGNIVPPYAMQNGGVTSTAMRGGRSATCARSATRTLPCLRRSVSSAVRAGQSRT